MTIERLNLGMKKVIVGIRLDENAKELLDWAVVKVADSGDSVLAIHVCRDSVADKDELLLDGYLDDYKGLCNKKQVDLSAKVLKGNSIRKVLVREAKNNNASAVIVGIAKHSGLRGWTSIAKYCAKRLPPTTEIMAIDNGKIIFCRCSKIPSEGPCLDPKPSFYINGNDNRSEFGGSELSETSRFSFDGKESNITEDVIISPARRKMKGSLSLILLPAEDFTKQKQRPGWPLLQTTSSLTRQAVHGKESNITEDVIISPARRKMKSSLSLISLPAEDFTKQRPGWPLLQTTSSLTQQAVEARKMSIVQWVMTTLPRRSLSDMSESDSHASYKIELPKDLEIILTRNSTGCKIFSHEVLKMSTSEFSSGNLIGKGGNNSVYKGIIPEEGKPVAVKILESSKGAWKNFIQEVDIITTLNHKRIAPLHGICVENNDLISVYDFMSKGNLEENLHGSSKGKSLLSWESRFRIAVGIAEAINYLHNKCPRPVIHRDIKSSNILLTDELEPQLCDFGLAIWGPTTTSFVMDSDVVGTFGYLAPEYFMYGKVSGKIDVYAFGVVLLELLSGRQPIGLETDKGGQESLVIWAKPRLESRDFKSILDPNLDGEIDETQMQRMAKAAASCLTQSSRLRPKMYQILDILNGEDCVDGAKPKCGKCDDEEEENKDDYNDDEVYPDSSAESHLSLAFLDVNDKSTSSSFSSSIDQNSPLSVEEYLKKRWSRSPSID